MAEPYQNRNQGPARSAGRQKHAAQPVRGQKREVIYVEDGYDYDRSVKLANRGCLIAVAAILVVAAIALFQFYKYIMNDMNGKNATAATTVTLNIPTGSGSTSISKLLVENGLIAHDNVFRFYVQINDAGVKFQAGLFKLEPGMSYDEILEVLSQPPTPRETINVTFPEGDTVQRFAAIVEEKGICSAEEFLAEANDLEQFKDEFKFIQYIDTQPNTYMPAEGYMAPNTYNLYVDETAENVVRELYRQFNREITDEVYARMDELGISLREVITLASLIEEEAGGVSTQLANVSRVFWNRLDSDLVPNGELPRRTLGSDATLRYISDWVARGYGSPSFAGMTLAQTKERLLQIMPAEVFYAYYTGDEDAQTNEGLPVGPISNPNRTSVMAALYPSIEKEVSNALYFVSDKYGNYYYAQTYGQHLKNIDKTYAMNEQYEIDKASGALDETPVEEDEGDD